MKLFLPILFLCIAHFSIAQQTDGYVLSEQDISYASLTSPSLLFENWDSDTLFEKLDFQLSLFGDEFSSVWVSPYGTISTSFTEEETPLGHVFLGGFIDFYDISSISYQIENDILKVEWKDVVSFVNDTDSIFVNFQIWMHDDGTVEYLYGDLDVAASTSVDDFLVGILQNYGLDDSFQNFWIFQNDSTDLSKVFMKATCDFEDDLPFHPMSNKKYILTPNKNTFPLPFDFKTFQEDYHALENANVLLENEFDSTIVIELPFNVELFGKNLSKLYVYSDGLINSQPSNDYIISGHSLFAFTPADGFTGVDLLSKTEGDDGNRIFKLEWKKADFFSTDSIEYWTNFQVWFYEKDNSFEYRYGPSSFSDSLFQNAPIYIGLIENFDENTELADNLWIEYGDIAHPNFYRTCDINYLDSKSSSYPFENLVYRFGPEDMVAVNDIHVNDAVKINPTITHDLINIQASSKVEKIQVINSQGVFVIDQSNQWDIPTVQLDVSNLQNGSYFLRITTENGVETKKIIKM